MTCKVIHIVGSQWDVVANQMASSVERSVCVLLRDLYSNCPNSCCALLSMIKNTVHTQQNTSQDLVVNNNQACERQNRELSLLALLGLISFDELEEM